MHNINNGDCWLKNITGPLKYARDFISGLIHDVDENKELEKPKPKEYVNIVDDYDIDEHGPAIGHGLGNISTCIQLCYDNSECIAFVHTPKNEGTCWLKKVIGPLTYAKDFTSGFICSKTDGCDNSPAKKRRLMFPIDHDEDGNPVYEDDDDESRDKEGSEGNKNQLDEELLLKSVR